MSSTRTHHKQGHEKKVSGQVRDDRQKLVRLWSERRKLASRLAKLDTKISKLKPRKRAPSPAALDLWIDELTNGLPDMPPLPADLSRSDFYDDHD